MTLPIAALAAYWKDHTPKRVKTLLTLASNTEELKKIPAQTLRDARWTEDSISSFLAWRSSVDEPKILDTLHRFSIHIITPEDTAYPRLLAPLPDKPLALFVRGTLASMRGMLATVGTRECSDYGLRATEHVIAPLRGAPIGIVSGLALGIDGKAHNTAMDTDLYTIAVLGSGIDEPSIYPRAHARIAARILDCDGAILSEYPPGFRPTPYSFPARNRIIAGLTHATLVVEGTENSGSLLTAKAALEYGRDVAAIPHPIGTPHGAGPNRLIRDGAALIRNHTDILTLLSMEDAVSAPMAPRHTHTLSGDARAIYNYVVQHGPCPIDHISRGTGLSAQTVTTTITLLEVDGAVQRNGPMDFRAI
jgi:DNA processing protein